ncbi:MAG: hypothetical protein ACKPKO_51065, partial [Candidatus Fonsibacter sp.]
FNIITQDMTTTFEFLLPWSYVMYVDLVSTCVTHLVLLIRELGENIQLIGIAVQTTNIIGYQAFHHVI